MPHTTPDHEHPDEPRKGIGVTYFGSKDLFTLFAKLPDERKTALLYKLTLTAQKEQKEEGPDYEEMKEKADLMKYLLELGSALNEFAQHATHVAERAKPMEKRLEQFCSKKVVTSRQDVLLIKNPHVRFVDSHVGILWEHFSRIRALGVTSQDFHKDFSALMKRIEEIQKHLLEAKRRMSGEEPDSEEKDISVAFAMDNMNLLRDLEHQILGFLATTKHLKDFCCSYVATSKGTQKDTEEYFKDMQWLYGERGDYDPEQLQIENMMQMYRGGKPKPPKADVPVMQGNVRWTGFLHEAVQQIPLLEGDAHLKANEAKDDSSKKKSPKKEKDEPSKTYDETKVAEYAEYLRSLADVHTLRSVREGAFFKEHAAEIGSLYGHFHALGEAYHETEIEAITQRDPHSPQQKYTRKMEEVQRKIKPGGEDEDAFENFDPDKVCHYLGIVDFGAIKTDPPVSEGEKERRKSHDLHARLFQKLEERIVAMAQQRSMERDSGTENLLGDESLYAFVRELIDLKHELPAEQWKKRKKRKDREKMRKDKESGNVAFVPTIGIMDLRLEQIPTTNDRFEDLYGQSWTLVRTAIESIFAYGRHSNLWELGSPTERFNQNMLIFGPPGCGKTKFGRAFANCPDIVSVLSSTNRIGSPYIHEAEANVRRLWEATYDMTHEYGKPAGIFWDEFETVTEDGGDENARGGSLKAMRKVVQMVLDGDVHYDGVSLIAFSNEPDKIPPEIYQRFGSGNVHLIKALTREEREKLMRHWLSGIPLNDRFEDETKWDEFGELSEDAAGRILGTVAQKCHRTFLERFFKKHPRHAETANEKFGEFRQEGVRVTPNMKRGVYEARGGSKGIEFWGEEFNIIMRRVLQDDVVQAAKIAQQKFYESYDKMMQRAHGHKFD